MQPGLHRTNGATDDRRGLSVIHFVEIAQHHRLAIVGGQRQHGLMKGVNGPASVQFTEYVPIVWDVFQTIGLLLASHNVRPFTIQATQHEIPGDAEQISVQWSPIRIVLSRIPYQNHKNFLRDFFSNFGASAHLQREPEYRPLMPAVQGSERLLVSSPHQPKQIAVAVGWGIQHVLFDDLHGLLLGIHPGMQKGSLFLGMSRQRNLWVTDTVEWCREAALERSRRTRCRMVGRRLLFVASCLFEPV